MYLVKVTPTLLLNPGCVESIREENQEYSSVAIQTVVTMSSGAQHVFTDIPLEAVTNRVLGMGDSNE